MPKKIKSSSPEYGDLKPSLERAIRDAKKNKASGGFLHISIDNLPMVISSQGGENSEKIVLGLIDEIASLLKKGDKVIRRNRNTLKILLKNCSRNKIKEKALEIHQAIVNYGCMNSLEPVQLTATIGSVDFPASSDNATDVINKAYIALSDAQESNTHYVAYKNEAKHEAESRNQMILASYLQNAFLNKRLRLAYQPIVASKTGNIAYYESLLRIVDAEGKTSSAGPFIPIAEKMGFIDVIDMMVFQMAVDELRKAPGLKLAINVSNASMNSSEWLEMATKLLKDKTIAERIIVETIETSEQHNIKRVIHFITTLQKFGCKVALDDFGTGYTSFAQLRILPVDIIKIDGSFVRDITYNEKNRFFVKTLLDFSRNFGLKTVAEFVEDKETADLLTKMKVDYLQGNYFSPAVNYRDWMEGEAKA